ncbi:unnamed protein product [Ceutorhynchus assimilis]|uniref:Coactosin-like protein n=1 Tax=Ceutorhynchus assimilis TaxID=467358 RepID=A0A9N9MNT5_9CUCU|nr:unnamed protein product [Ceutorhynchus assimilis]
MPLESETVTGNPDAPQQNSEQELVQVSDNDSQALVQEDACVFKSKTVEEEEIVCPLKLAKSPVAEATEDFLVNEIKSYVEVETNVNAASIESPVSPSTPANSDVEESVIEPEPPQIVDVSYNEKENVPDEVIIIEKLNGHHIEESVPLAAEEEPTPILAVVEPEPEIKLTNGNNQAENFNGECKFEPKKVEEPSEVVEESEVLKNGYEKPALNGTIASELPDYKLPDVVEVKKNFEFVAPAGNNRGHVQPKKGALSTTIDSQGVRQAYQDVRNDGSETQWAIFKFEGPTIVTSATGADFEEFTKHFGEDDRAFAYIRVQTGDEMSRRAKFLLFTWVGPNVSVLKRAKMSTDKALIKDIVSNFAVELQTENLTDITLQNFETELDKAAGAHYGTGIRS